MLETAPWTHACKDTAREQKSYVSEVIAWKRSCMHLAYSADWLFN